MTRPIRIALLFWADRSNTTLSYQHGWPKAFLESPRFSCVPINLAGRGWAGKAEVVSTLMKGGFEAIVVMHSCFSNQQNLRRLLLWVVSRCPQPKAYFIGNEYKLMPEKIAFCRRLGISLLLSQSNDERVLEMYRKALGCTVACIPNTGLDTDTFYPVTPLAGRDIDIGFRAYEAPLYMGNNEKPEIADFFNARAAEYGLRVDISLEHKDRFDAKGYAAFLNRCRGQLGTESGSEFFELTDETRYRVNAFQKARPEATWPEIKAKFFDVYEGPMVPMRIISGRQVEAAACKTVQILFTGRYNDYFQPDEHYIPLEKDFSNADEVVRKLRDDAYCARLTDAAYDVAMGQLTYAHLLGRLADLLADVV
ncbi:glycosyltransferase [Oleispirillum naphthae]|uniref:glycosyltransferase n=1 Tax=Oleispirillum naphthae TaxID=2838853 RepID=UPI0030824D80